MQQVPLYPETASVYAESYNLLYWFLSAVAVVFTLAIALAIAWFAYRYRRRSEEHWPKVMPEKPTLEVFGSLGLLVLAMVIFFWGAVLFFRTQSPPADAMQVFVTGKQWMWKIQHPEGRREINELHVPAGVPVLLTLSSEDVIHSFYVPAFRMKMDAVPGKYTRAWFTATRPGEYHLFCAEYCGTEHSRMIGRVVVMEPADYEAWLGGATGEPMEVAGQKLFQRFACNTCHVPGSAARAPELAGLFGSEVPLRDGSTVIADEAYLRESILEPAAKVVAGFQPVMPTFRGQLGEEQVLQLVAYIKSLAGGEGAGGS